MELCDLSNEKEFFETYANRSTWVNEPIFQHKFRSHFPLTSKSIFPTTVNIRTFQEDHVEVIGSLAFHGSLVDVAFSS